jgi:hypothetical protein
MASALRAFDAGDLPHPARRSFNLELGGSLMHPAPEPGVVWPRSFGSFK